MPTYVYKFVDTGETIEVQQAFTDPTLTEIAHPDSGEVHAVKKVFTPVGVTFKGSGFFKTDNRGKKSAGETGGKKDADSKSDSTGSDSTGSGSTGSDSGGASSKGSGESTSATKESSKKSDTAAKSNGPKPTTSAAPTSS